MKVVPNFSTKSTKNIEKNAKNIEISTKKISAKNIEKKTQKIINFSTKKNQYQKY